MILRKTFLNLSKRNFRSFGTSSMVDTYKITSQASPAGPLKWISGKTKEEFEVPSPLESLLGTLAGCENATARYHAKKIGIDLKNISIRVEADYDKSHFVGRSETPNRFSEVRVDVEVESNATPEQLEQLRNLVHKCCPVYCMLALSGVDIKATWKNK